MQLKPHVWTIFDVLRDDEGATLVEYGLVVLFIAVVSIATLQILGPKVSRLFAPIAPAL